MKSIFTIKKILITLLLLLVVIQFVRIDKSVPKSDPSTDFIVSQKPTDEIQGILKAACYDCHSFETVYPWYSQIAPVSWWLKDHINEGRKELNFNLWTTFNARRQDKKLKECVELINEGEMPLESYTWIHKSAKLNQEQRGVLARYFETLRTHESDRPKEETESEH